MTENNYDSLFNKIMKDAIKSIYAELKDEIRRRDNMAYDSIDRLLAIYNNTKSDNIKSLINVYLGYAKDLIVKYSQGLNFNELDNHLDLILEQNNETH